MNVKPPRQPRSSVSDSLFLVTLGLITTSGLAMSAARNIVRRVALGSVASEMTDRELEEHYRRSRVASYAAIHKLFQVARTSMREPRVDLLDAVQSMLEKATEIEMAGLQVVDVMAHLRVSLPDPKSVDAAVPEPFRPVKWVDGVELTSEEAPKGNGSAVAP